MDIPYDLLTDAFRKCYRDRLIALAVYGSYARGDHRPNSDLDVLIVATDFPKGASARIREYEGVEAYLPASLAALISPTFFTPDEMKQGSLIFLNMTMKEILILLDDGTLKDYLDDLTRRLVQMGSRRVGTGRDSYWIMAPSGVPARDIVI